LSQRVFNLNAGPATLPLPVLEEAQRDLLSLPGLGMSILEISHRSSTFLKMLEEVEANLRTLLAIPDGYHVVFLPGGATLQFAMVPLSFLRPGQVADYVGTGAWGSKAYKEAIRVGGEARLAWDGKPGAYTQVPAPSEIAADAHAAYLHYTSNETIHGVEFHELPTAPTGVPLVCDASSNFLSRPLDVARHSLIYAGAQKNVGPAGVTVVILRDELLARIPDKIPSMLDYRLHVADKSNHNTPPVFTIYMVLLVTRWLLREVGDLAAMERLNVEKADRVYAAIDRGAGFYHGHAASASRSRMNLTFRLPDEETEKRFLAEATKRGFAGLKGHRSVGGIRASLYNAVTLEAAEAFASFLDDFRAAG
jgi:phosphoserine aminotransferase